MDAVNEVVSKVESYIGIIAEKFNAIAPEVWEILIKQQHIEFFCWLAHLPIFVLMWILVIFLFKKYFKTEDDGWQTGAVICSIIFGIITIIYLGWFGEVLPRLLNPEYYAIKEILSSIK